MSLCVKIWASDEARPEGDKLSNLTSAPPNWFHEELDYAVELYGLERHLLDTQRGVPEAKRPKRYEVFVLDDEGNTHEFTANVATKYVVRVSRKT
jgi:hypothetical protein